ncbi:uncharacterized protein LOC134241144 [Saccostrea cucullata]|uniref:uncharacterized protein LOC134241144 n=1 Tax=Saccostrea cuccullata TaxID=36930 RepID=UPI002ED478D6
MIKCAKMIPNVYTCLLVSVFFRVGLSRREVEMGTFLPEDIYVNKDAGETGRYYVTLESGDKYLCRYGNASASFLDSPAFSEECYYKNKDVLTYIEKNTGLFPYYHSVNLRPPGCGSLPNVTGAGGKWACPRGVSPSSVPVYESCHLKCISGASIKVRCTEKLEFDSLASHKCPIESTSQTEKVTETSRIFFSIASTLPSIGETHTEEKTETSRNFLFNASTVSSAVESMYSIIFHCNEKM